MCVMMEDKLYFNEIKDELKFLTNSKVRFQILTCLYDAPATVSEIHEITDLKYSSITSNLKKLVELDYVTKEDNEYQLKTHTRLQLLNILYLNNNLEFIHEYDEFLNNHIVVNDELQAIGTLPYIKNIELIQANNINPYLATETIEETMMRKGRVKSICIYLHPNCSGMIQFMMNQESDFEVIVPLEFAQYIIKHAYEYLTDIPLKNIRFNIKPLRETPLRIVLVVSEHEIVVGLVRKEGNFNKNCVLRSEDSSARAWGIQVFREFEVLKEGYIDIKELVRKHNDL